MNILYQVKDQTIQLLNSNCPQLVVSKPMSQSNPNKINPLKFLLDIFITEETYIRCMNSTFFFGSEKVGY